MGHIFIDHDKCKRDGFCVAACPTYVLEMPENDSVPVPVEDAYEICIRCGHCVAICPHEAISLSKMTWEDCDPLQEGLSPGIEQVEYLLKSRRSIRNFRQEPLEPETLERLIKIASRAPSGHNLQPVRWLVISGRDGVFELASLVCDWMREMMRHQGEIAASLHVDRVVDAFDKGRDRILRNAPHLIVVHAPGTMITAQPSCTIALTYFELGAWSAGLGACWAGYFTAAAGMYQPLIKALALPEGHQVFGAMMAGRRKYEYQRIPTRKPPRIEWRP